MYDAQELINALRSAKVDVEGYCDIGKLVDARRRCDEALKDYRKAKVEFTSNISDRSEREKALSTAKALITSIVGRLLRAYGQQSDIENVLTLGRDALEDFKTATHKETREAASAFIQATYGGFSDMVECAKTFGVDERFEEGGFAEQIACMCYGIIIAGSGLVRQYEESESFENGHLLHRKQAAEQMNPPKAFSMFVESYKILGKIYEDEGLQEGALAFHEIDDVWKLSAEVRKLAEAYRDKTLQQKFLTFIATTMSESILYYGRSAKSDAARASYEELKNIVEEHEKDDNELVYVRAKGAANLIDMLLNTEQVDEATSVYGELKKLAEKKYPEKPNLLVWQTGGRASEIIYAYAKAKKFDDAVTVYEELRKLADEYDEAKLRAWQANGAFYLTYEYFKAGMPDEARSMFQQLEEVVDYADHDLRQQKKDGMPLIDWLRQLVQKGNA